MVNYMLFCQVVFTFTNNTLTNQNGQGQSFYAEDVTHCVLGHTINNTGQVFNSSIFSDTTIFNFRQVDCVFNNLFVHCLCSQESVSLKSNFETAPRALNLVSIDIFLG